MRKKIQTNQKLYEFSVKADSLKGVVDKINDVLDIFNAHIRTQEGRLPQKIS